MTATFDVFRAERIDRRDMNAFRKFSEQLDQALVGDFAFLDREMVELFPETPEVSAMPFNVVRRVADMFSRLYREPVQRRFISRSTPAFDFGKLAEIYRRSRIDAALLQAHRRLVPQQSQYLIVVPDSVRKVRVLAFSPWRVDITPGNTLFADDVRHAAEVRFWIEVAREVGPGYSVSRFGWIVLTQTEAWIEAPGGAKTSLYNVDAPDDLSHPFDGIPVVDLVMEDPPVGMSFPPVDEPLRAILIAMAARVGDLAHILHFQGYGQPVIENPGGDANFAPQQSSEDLVLGANRLLNLREGTFRIVTANAQIGEYNTFIESLLRWYALTAGVDQDQFMKAATARTAVSRRFDRLDRGERRRNYVVAFRRAENRLVQLVARLASAQDLVKLPDDVFVEVKYRDAPEAVDPVADGTARKSEYDEGERSEIDYIVDRDNVPRNVAADRVARNLAERALLTKIRQLPADQLAKLARDVPRSVVAALSKITPPPMPPAAGDAGGEQ